MPKDGSARGRPTGTNNGPGGGRGDGRKPSTEAANRTSSTSTIREGKASPGSRASYQMPKAVHAYTLPPALAELIKEEAWRRRTSASALVTAVLTEWKDREGLETS